MKKRLHFLVFLLLIAGYAFGQEYADTLGIGPLDSEADLDDYPEYPFDFVNGSEFPVIQRVSFEAGEAGSTEVVDVNLKMTFEGDKFDPETGEVIDSMVYLNFRSDKFVSISPWPSDTLEGVLNGDYRQFNFDEQLTVTFDSVNNTPPSELYPDVQMSLFGIGAWSDRLGESEVYLNGELAGVWISTNERKRLVTPILTDAITQQPVKIAIEEGDVLTLKSVREGTAAYYRLVGFACVMEDTKLPTSLTLSAEGGVAEITELADTLRILAEVLPEDASDKRVIWSIEDNGTGATINSGGLLFANPRESGNGTVTVTAKLAADESVTQTMDVTISGQYDVPVSSIELYTMHDDTIRENGGSILIHATVLPEIAANKDVVWSVIDNGTGATIDEEGLLQANPRNEGNGTVQVVANAADGSGVTDTLDIVIMNQETTFLEVITIQYEGDFAEITENGGTLQLTAEVIPENATDPSVDWSVIDNGTGATIDSTGLLTASGTDDGNGTVTVVAAAVDGSGVTDSLDVMIVGQSSPESVGEPTLADALTVYPNPFHEGQMITVRFAGEVGRIETIDVYQITGKEVASYSNFRGLNHAEFAIGGANGIYLIQVTTDKGVVVQKVLKDR